MKKLSAILLFLCLGVSARLGAVALGTGTDPNGNACDTVTWLDATGQSRTVWIKNSSPGGFITRYTWNNNGTPVDARLRENYPPWGFLVLVNHWHPESTGAYVTSCDATNLTVPMSKSVPFQGAHHLVWRATFRMKMDPAASTSWYNTVQFLFADGRNDFVFSTTYDSTDMPEASIWSDNRSPYGDFDWDGNGSSNESISGIGWGTTYKFRSTEAPLSSTSNWDFTQPNTIPYIWQWKDASLNNAELAIVQNMRYQDQAAGGETHVGGCAGFTAAPSTGTNMSDIEGAYKACVAYQLNVYANWTGQRFTWGSVFKNAWGMFGNGKSTFADGHNDALGTYTYPDDYPVNAWSWNVLVGRYTDNGQAALVGDTENVYASTLSASVGSVNATGPRGPGTYTATGTMPTITYPKAGFDPVHRAWRATGAGNQATLNFTVSGSLKRPSIVVQSMSALPCLVQLDGVTQVDGVDVMLSYDAGTNEAWVTFLKDLGAGARTVVIHSMCGTPTYTPTVCGACSATSTRTPSSTPSATPSATPVPACSGLLVDNVEDGNLSNAVGGSWSSYAAAPAGTGLPVAAGPGYTGSGYGALYAISVTGANSGAQVGSLSTSFGAPTDLGSKDSLSFWIKANGGGTTYRMNIARSAVTDYDNYGASFTAPANVWTKIVLPLNSMTQAGWGTAVPRAWTDVTGLTLYNTAVGAYRIMLDDISFDCPGPTATPSPSRTASPSPTASPTQTRTPTPPLVGSSPTQTPSTFLTPCGADSFGSFLQSGDKILFLGDSITYRGNFTGMVERHLQDRFPAAGFSFVNSGGPGEAAMQVWARMSGVLSQNPDVVIICLGMNDAYGLGTYQTDYPNYMNQIVNALQGAGIRVALMTPGVVDLSLPFTAIAADYNTRLRWIADWTLTYAASKSLPVYDINAQMAAADTALKAALPGACMIPDSVHPDPAGGWVMGLGALKALGVPDRCGDVYFVGSSAYVEASGSAVVSGANSTGFDIQLGTLPPVAPAAARKILPYEPLQSQLNHLRLVASGLPAANYYLVIDGHRSGPVSAGALAAGVNLYDHWTAPGSSPSQVHHIDLLDAAGQPATVCDAGAADGLVDDFETAPLGNWLVNRWAGDLWGLDAGTGTSTVSPAPSALTLSSPGYDGSGSCLRFSGNADLGPGNPPVLLTYLNALNSDVKQGVRFWVKGLAGKQVRFQIHTWYEKRQSPEYWNDYGYTFTCTGAWQQVSVPYSSLTLPAWGTPYAFDPQEIYNLDWLPFTAGAYDISVDQIEFYCTGPVDTPTPTRTATATRTASPSATPSLSASTTPSSSATKSPTASFSPTPSSSASPTVSDTPTPLPPGVTLTSSPSGTPTATRTATPASTPTWTPTASSSATAIASGTRTATGTSSATPMGTFSSTPTPTHSSTATPVSTGTAGTGGGAAVATPTGALQVLAMQAVPNPNPKAMAVFLNGPADAIELRVYSVAGACVIQVESGPRPGGWNQVALPDTLGNGVFFARVVARRGAQRSLSVAPAKWVVLK